MMSEAERSAGILRLFQNKEALNLSAVEVACPELLEGLFQAENFIGWKEAIELAGVPMAEIRIEPRVGIICLICGHEAEVLWQHLNVVHGINAAEYRAEFPGVEAASEAMRAEKMSHRHGRPAKKIMPHWEPAWSQTYALDRIHELARQGIPLNYSYLAKREPGFPAYVRRVFPTWDAGLAAAGINPKTVRVNRESRELTADDVIKSLQKRERENPGLNHIKTASSTSSKVLITSAFRNFFSYDAALATAGIDPVHKIPALGDVQKVKARKTLVKETAKRLKERPAYTPVKTKKFLDRHAGTIKDFYKSWLNFSIAMKVFERDIFNSPTYHNYDSQKDCIKELQKRAAHGLSLRQEELRVDNPSLEIMSTKHFGTYASALKAAKLTRKARFYDKRFYPEKKDVMAEIKRRCAAGESLLKADLDRLGGKGNDRNLLRWSARHFGTYREALRAVGMSEEEQIKFSSKATAFRFPDGDSVIAAIQDRAAKNFPLSSSEVRLTMAQGGDKTLIDSSNRHFGSWKKALKTAGL